MTTSTTTISSRKDKWLENFARFGFIAKGIVYSLVGILTAMAAFGTSGKKANKADAFNTIYEQPFGKILLAIVAIGLLGYVTWRFYQAILDTEHKGKNSKGLAERIGYAISALVYLGLGIYAMKLVFNGQSTGDSNSKQFIVSKVLDYPAGAWIIGIVALIIIGKGIWQIYQAFTGKFMKKVHVASSYSDVFKKAGVVGYISRGIVLSIVGYFLLHAAIEHNPTEAQGTDAAFGFLENKFGSILMGLVAVGLIGYGIFMFVKAKYERIQMHG